MADPRNLQGQVQFQDLAGDHAFASAPVQDQIDYLRESYLPPKDKAFAQASKQVQEQYIKDQVLPQLQAVQRPQIPFQPHQQLRTPQVSDHDRNSPGQILKDLAAATMLTSTGALKGASLGYADLTGDARKSAEIIGASPELYNGGLAGNIATTGGETAGMVASLGKMGAGLDTGLARAGQKVLPYTTEIAQASGVGSRFARPALRGLSYLQSRNMGAQMLRAGAEFGGYEGLKRRENVPVFDPRQFDPLGRAASTLQGFASGAVFPPLMAGGGKVLQGIAHAGQEFVKPPAEVGIQTLLNKQAQALKAETFKVFESLVKTYREIQTGKIDPTLVQPEDYVSLVKTMEELAQSLEAGKPVPNLKSKLRITHQIEGKAKIKAKLYKRPIESPELTKKPVPEPLQARIQETQTPKPTTIEKEIEETIQKQVPIEDTPKPHGTLTGSVQEMVSKGLEKTGMNLDKAKTLLAQVKELGKAEDHPEIKKLTEQKKALGNKRDDATKEAKAELDAQIQKIKDERKALRSKVADIHPNLTELLSTGWDGESPLSAQIEVSEKQLKLDDVKGKLNSQELAKGEKIEEALKAGVSVRLEHAAEITGSTDKAATITSKGQVKVATSTFTPTHFGVNTKIVSNTGEVLKKGSKAANEALEAGTAKEQEYVSVYGYNETGHIHQYYLTKSPEGSEIVKVGKQLSTEQHVGTLPNVYLGKRQFKAADVLKRVPEGEGIKTSEAIQTLGKLSELYKPEIFNQFSKPVRSTLNAIRKRGRVTKMDLILLAKQIAKESPEMEELCKLLGVHNG